jgi:host factor-I protein
MSKNAQQPNMIQDGFFNSARKERANVTIYLMSGVKLSGKIKSFDKYSLILQAGSQEQLVFKHAISTVLMSRSPSRYTHARGHIRQDEVESGASYGETQQEE